jgi:hypothetical protein
MSVAEAMGTPRGREVGTRYLRSIVEEMKSTGFIARVLARSDQPNAAVTPLARIDAAADPASVNMRWLTACITTD